MYKVFFNQKSIIITVPTNITLNKTTRFFVDSYLAVDIKNWFSEFVNNETTEVFLFHKNPKQFFELFKSVFIQLPAAGGIVFRKNKMLFIFRNGKWDLPKGKIETGEINRDAAIREVEEECGIRHLEIKKQLPSTFHVYQSPYKKKIGEWIFKETFWFEMNYTGEDLGTPQKSEGITKTEWLSKNKLDEVLENTYENLKQIILIYRD